MPLGPVLVTGAGGLLGAALIESAPAGVRLVAQTRRTPLPAPLRTRALEERLDLGDAAALEACLARHGIAAVIHAAARTSPPDCEEHPAAAEADNVAVTRAVVDWCRDRGVRVLYCSTDLVFDGLAPPYREEAARRPVSVYGRTKAAAEDLARAAPGALVARLPLLVGRSPGGRRSVDETLLDTFRRGARASLFDDEIRTPLHALLAARLLWELFARGVAGVIHVAGRERVSRWDLGCALAARLGLPRDFLERRSLHEYRGRPPRCPDVSLDCGRLEELLGRPAPALAESLALPLAGAGY